MTNEPPVSPFFDQFRFGDDSQADPEAASEGEPRTDQLREQLTERMKEWAGTVDMFEILPTLSALAEKHPKDSKEYSALTVAALSYQYIRTYLAMEQFKKYMAEYFDQLTDKEKACYKIMGYSIHGEDWDEQ